MIPKMILEPRLNLDTKLNFEPMFCRPYQTYRPRDDLQRLYLMKERLKPDKIESKPNLMAWRAARNFRARPFRPRLNLHAKLSFEPMIFRPYQMCRQRDSLQSVENKIKRIQRHVGQVGPGYVDFRPYKMCRPRDDLQRLYLISEHVELKKTLDQASFLVKIFKRRKSKNVNRKLTINKYTVNVFYGVNI